MTIYPYIWSAIVALVGVWLGWYLSTRTQKANFVLLAKKEEYRELIGTLTQSFTVILDFHTEIVAHKPEEQRAEHQARLTASAVIGDRLFIADDIKELDLLNRWRKAVDGLRTSGTVAFAGNVGEILSDIAKSARSITE